MIRTNLSTRPFYNTRAVRAVLTIVTAIVVAVTAYNAVQVVRLTATQRRIGAKASDAEREATRLRAEAVQVLSRVDPKELATVDKAAREANAIIDQRTFSWTEVFAHLERTLPPDVRITSVRQQAGRQAVLLDAEARDIDDVDAFIEALEKTGAFHNVIAVTEVVMENGTIAANLEATYTPLTRPAEAAQ